MLITLNNEGQVVDIQDSTLVANSTYGDAVIAVTFDKSVSYNTLLSFKSCTLSVIRNDSVVIDGLYMEKDVDNRLYRFNSMTDSGILDVTGSLQLSVQIAAGSGIFASVSIAAFVQQNIGKLTKEEADDVETRLKALYITPISDTLAKKLDILPDADSSWDKAYIMLSAQRSEGSDAEVLKQPYAFIARNGYSCAYGILGATKNGDYLIPSAKKDGNPVNLGQLTTILADYIKTAEKGDANGVAPLEYDSRISYDYLPTAVKDVVDKFITKVDVLEAGTRDKLYCKPSKNSDDQNEFRYTNETGARLPHSVLAADSNGDFIVPEPQNINSPVRKQDVTLNYIPKLWLGKIGGGVPRLNDNALLDDEYLSFRAQTAILKAESAIQPTSGGKANGYAKLDAYGKVPAENLPAYVDDVLDVYVRDAGTKYSSNWLSLSDGGTALTPEGGKIYVIVKGTYANHQYRWSGSQYVEIKSSLALGETTGTAYDGGKGKALDTRLKTAETNITELTSGVGTLNTETEALKETATEHGTAIEKNVADIAAITDKVNIGEVVVGDTEPIEEQVDAWVDTSEAEIPDTVLKAGTGMVITEETNEEGENIVKVAVKTSSTTYTADTDGKTYSHRSSLVKEASNGNLYVRDSNQTFKAKNGDGFDDDAIVTVEADDGIEIEEIAAPPTIKIKNTKKFYRHYIRVKCEWCYKDLPTNKSTYTAIGIVYSSSAMPITDLTSSLRTLLGVAEDERGVLPLYDMTIATSSDSSHIAYVAYSLTSRLNVLSYHMFTDFSGSTSSASLFYSESYSNADTDRDVTISLIDDTVVEI